MKDELNSLPIKEFVGLRQKMYSILDGNNKKEDCKKNLSNIKETKIET